MALNLLYTAVTLLITGYFIKMTVQMQALLRSNGHIKGYYGEAFIIFAALFYWSGWILPLAKSFVILKVNTRGYACSDQ